MTVRAPRSYGQMCGLALSLDLLGERWTMLILRELARGPKRFGDLAGGLEGIGTNLLSARLKSLEENGLVEKVTLPPPAPVQAYDLTERGRDLQPILEDLALWGFGLFPQRRRGSGPHRQGRLGGDVDEGGHGPERLPGTGRHLCVRGGIRTVLAEDRGRKLDPPGRTPSVRTRPFGRIRDRRVLRGRVGKPGRQRRGGHGLG